MDFEKIKEYLRENLNDFRFKHTLRVVDMGLILSDKFNYEDKTKVMLGCYFHDAGKNLPSSKLLEIAMKEGYVLSEEEKENIHIYHGVASMSIARDYFKINDVEVLNSIKNHVTGCENMSMLDKIVFLADFFEVCRDYDRVHKSREAALNDLDINTSLLLALNSSLNELISKNRFIHENTIKARNYILREIENI